MEPTQKLSLTKTPFQIFSKNIAAIAHIQQIIHDIDKLSVHKPLQKKQYLLSSYIVFLISSWEWFIENSISFQVNKILKDRELFDKIKVQLRKTDLTPGDYKTYADKKIYYFNVPIVEKIDELVKKTLGLHNISNKWLFQNLTLNEIAEKNDSIYNLRGSIAHRGYINGHLTFEDNFKHMEFIYSIADQTEKIIMSYIKDI